MQESARSIERITVGDFDYERLEVRSDRLNRDVKLGRALPRGLRPEQVQGTLYVLHGGNGDDRQSIDAGLLELLPAELTAAWASQGLQLVFPWVGTSFLRSPASQGGEDWAGYFWSELLPLMEGGTRTSDDSRWMTGYSMGGQAALNVFLRQPGSFAGAGAFFPTLIAFDYTDPSQVEAFAARARVSEAYLKVLVDGFTSAFESLAHFSAHDPLALARGIDPRELAGKTLSFAVGSDDEFGLHEGAEVLSQVLTERGVAHSFECVGNGHHDLAFLQSRFVGLLQAVVGIAPGPLLRGSSETVVDLNA